MENKFEVYSKLAVGELTDVFSKMKNQDVEPLLGAIEQHKRIFTLGAGREGISTRAFSMRLMHLGKDVHWVWDDTTPGISAGDLFICACGSATVGHEVYMCKRAKEAGAKLLLITASDDGELNQIADIVVKIPAEAYLASGDFVKSNQMMGNLFEQALYIFFDAIVMTLADRMNITKEEMETRHRNIE